MTPKQRLTVLVVDMVSATRKAIAFVPNHIDSALSTLEIRLLITLQGRSFFESFKRHQTRKVA